ncbi:MAG TPA: alpha-amylase/4-alpha-glucanotransferase domain-containing protein [Gemmatimonadaceae bacterium]
MTAEPIRFCFGLHLHQPVGNFGYVFEQHVRDVYRPFLERVRAQGFFPITLHVSGPLIEWLDQHEPSLLDDIADLASDGRVELLLAGFYEPILASLSRADRLTQIAWMREVIRSRLGAEAIGLWLTERVWEPDLAADLHDAGVAFALVDDRHFLASGFPRDQLHAPFRTEHDGKPLALFPIDERLRYLIPFQPPEDTVSYLRALRAQGRSLAVLADDGEKFGGWPGTREWVYDNGWLDRFFAAMREVTERGEVILSRFDEALGAVPSGGLAYLPTASYREMEGWSLPAPAAQRFTALEHELGEDRLRADGALVRGAHWRNFLVKYPESNRMHKKTTALSALCRQRGDPPDARRAIGRAQCNDAYWHGVFGGLYLPFLRAEIWRNLAIAERLLRRNDTLQCEAVDLDTDGFDELWIHSSQYSALVSPSRGGAIEELTRFALGENLGDTLTRRREAYHFAAVGKEVKADSEGPADSTPSIHDLEASLFLAALPPVDLDDRALFIERVLSGDVTAAAYESAVFTPLASYARTAMEPQVDLTDDTAVVTLLAPDAMLMKQLTFFPDGSVAAKFSWRAAAFPADSWFTTEISVSRPVTLTAPGATVWDHPIETVAKSERGLDRTLQGTSYLVRWPVSLGAGEVELRSG